MFLNDYIANGECTIGLTGPPVDDIMRVELKIRNDFIVQSGSYAASTPRVRLDTQWQGFTKGFLEASFFMLKASCQRDMFMNAYGGIIRQQLTAGEKMMIDNYHLVALSN
ncbi:MAG TPA: AIM24 family protein [Nitrososphaera sp.]|nr:AIM24 family protein [Nitrososphaera sp.]